MFTRRTQIREQDLSQGHLDEGIPPLQLNRKFCGFFFAKCQDTRLTLNASPVSLPFFNVHIRQIRSNQILT